MQHHAFLRFQQRRQQWHDAQKSQDVLVHTMLAFPTLSFVAHLELPQLAANQQTVGCSAHACALQLLPIIGGSYTSVTVVGGNL